MFDGSRPRQAWRSVEPPQPVIVNLARALPPDSLTWGIHTPLWVRASGNNVAAEVRGELYAWVLSSVGRWWACVRFAARSRNGELNLDLDQLILAEAVRPVDPRNEPLPR